MLSLVMPRDGWHPPVVRTVASENKGIEELAGTVRNPKHLNRAANVNENTSSIGKTV